LRRLSATLYGDLLRLHWTSLCHVVSIEFGQRTTNSPASERIIRAAPVCVATSDGLVLLFIVSIKCPSFTSHVPVRWYVLVRSGWLNHDSSIKLPSAVTVFVHRIPASCRNHTPAKCWRKSLSNLATLTCCQCSNRHATTMTTTNPIIVIFFMVEVFEMNLSFVK